MQMYRSFGDYGVKVSIRDINNALLQIDDLERSHKVSPEYAKGVRATFNILLTVIRETEKLQNVNG